MEQKSRKRGVVESLNNLKQRHAARTKLMLKFWTAMHTAGIPKEQEWYAQEKIKVEDLAEILRRNANGGII